MSDTQNISLNIQLSIQWEQELVVGRLSDYPEHVNSIIDRNVEKKMNL